MKAAEDEHRFWQTVLIIAAIILGIWWLNSMINDRIAHERTMQFLDDHPGFDAWLKAQARRSARQ
jgi:hypothetical protein